MSADKRGPATLEPVIPALRRSDPVMDGAAGPGRRVTFAGILSGNVVEVCSGVPDIVGFKALAGFFPNDDGEAGQP